MTTTVLVDYKAAIEASNAGKHRVQLSQMDDYLVL